MIELPDSFIHSPPSGYGYEVEEHKRNVLSIWLCHQRDYIYSTDKVKTIWGFYDVKKKVYYKPVNSRKVGEKVDIRNTRSYTAMSLNLNPLEHALFSSN